MSTNPKYLPPSRVSEPGLYQFAWLHTDGRVHWRFVIVRVAYGVAWSYFARWMPKDMRFAFENVHEGEYTAFATEPFNPVGPTNCVRVDLLDDARSMFRRLNDTNVCWTDQLVVDEPELAKLLLQAEQFAHEQSLESLGL